MSPAGPPGGSPGPSPSPDERFTPAQVGRFEMRERASRFLSVAAPCASPDAASDLLAGLRRTHHDATHVAFAWTIVRERGVLTRSSDDGEPSGTAGRPIAAAIESAGISDVVVAVVRWFGGTRLGTGGLARAYREAAAGAIAAAGRERIYERRVVAVRSSYARVGELRRLVRPPEIVLVSEEFREDALIRFGVLRSRAGAFLLSLNEARFDYDMEESPPEDGAQPPRD